MPQSSTAAVQSASPSYYRLYTLDQDGHIVDVRDFEAGGDMAAIVEAGETISAQHRELWTGARRVLELPSPSSR